MLYGAIAGLTLSGALWLLFHYFVSGDGEFGYLTHPLEPWWLKIHGAFGMFALILLGSLIPNHIAKAWQRRRNRITGGVNVAVFAVLVLTGYFLYYLGDETWRGWVSRPAFPCGCARAFRECAPTCPSGRAGNKAWPGARRLCA